jgi:3-deoxy-D-manno-octulosonic-acid transferase
MGLTHWARRMPQSWRWAAFRGLEALAQWRQGASSAMALHSGLQPAGTSAPSLWLFVSTIGELNAIAPLLERLLATLGHPPLTLLSDRPVYADAYRARLPQARQVFLTGGAAEAGALGKATPPSLFVIAEIPAMLHDAPCRMSFALLRAAKHAGAPVVLVNGWSYGYAPPSRMDAIELALFGQDYLRSFDMLLVQTPTFASALVAAGAPADRVRAVGNIKFDAMDMRAWTPDSARSPWLLRALLDSGRPRVVAGCVTDADEQQRVLNAFVALRRNRPDALLVLAPRHPENPAVIQRLHVLLGERGLSAIFRSTLGDTLPAPATAVLVLDTMGELRDFYAAADVAHVGMDHNVLEPLGFGKPVTVSPGWTRTYPSFPVYDMLHQAQGLLEATTAGQLAAHWADCLAAGAAQAERLARTRSLLDSARGATDRHMQALAPWLQPLSTSRAAQLAGAGSAASQASNSR